MTYDGGKPHPVGDRGQRFEVSVYDEDKGKRIVCGWTDNADDASKMATSFALRPGWSLEQVRDRQPIGAEQPIVKLRIKLTKAEKEIALLTEQAATDKDCIEQYQRQVEKLTTERSDLITNVVEATIALAYDHWLRHGTPIKKGDAALVAIDVEGIVSGNPKPRHEIKSPFPNQSACGCGDITHCGFVGDEGEQQ